MCEPFAAEESRLDKNDNVENDQNNEASLSLEMKGEEVIFQKPKKKKRKKIKYSEGDEDSNDKNFDLHEVQTSETLTVTHKLKKKKKKRSKVQLTHEPCKLPDSSSIDLTDHTDSNEINLSMQTSREKKLKKRKQEKRSDIFNASDNNVNDDDCEEGRPPMAKKKKLEDGRGDSNVETKISWEAANENCVQVSESFVKRKKKKRKRRNEILSALSDSVFPETAVQIEKVETTAYSNIVNEDVERNEPFHKDYILIKRKNRKKKLKNKTNHHETLESCPQNKENSNHFCVKNGDFQNNDAQSSLTDMDSEVEESCVGRIGAEVQRNQNVENSELTRHGTLVKQEILLVNNDATKRSSDYTTIAPAALEESVKNSDSSRYESSVKQDNFPGENEPTKTSSDYTNMLPATLEERDPEIAALHATSRLHPHPEFLKELKEKGILVLILSFDSSDI